MLLSISDSLKQYGIEVARDKKLMLAHASFWFSPTHKHAF